MPLAIADHFNIVSSDEANYSMFSANIKLQNGIRYPEEKSMMIFDTITHKFKHLIYLKTLETLR